MGGITCCYLRGIFNVLEYYVHVEFYVRATSHQLVYVIDAFDDVISHRTHISRKEIKPYGPV